MKTTQFGITAKGEPVQKIILDNGLLCCHVITFGATVQKLFVPDKSGNPVDVVLGYDTLAQYEQEDGYFGATVGRVANRIADGKFTLNGKTYTLSINNGPNHLHGGIAGFSHRVWKIAQADETSVTLALESPDGDEGYPGKLSVAVQYVLRGNQLSIHYRADAEADTPCSLTNHTYFNLAGHGSGDVLQQKIQIFASHYTPTNAVSIPYGTIEPVTGTPMDLQHLQPIGKEINTPFIQLQQAKGYDHNYVIDGQPGTLRPAVMAKSQESGITLQVQTTFPGMQFYTANYIEEGLLGKDDCIYGPRQGFCLETQYFPDSPNQSAFPSIILHAGKSDCHTTTFTFSAEK